MAEILVFNERAGNFNPRKHNPELIANFLEAAGIVGIQVISLSQWLDWVNRSYNALSFVYQFLPEEEWKDKITVYVMGGDGSFFTVLHDVQRLFFRKGKNSIAVVPLPAGSTSAAAELMGWGNNNGNTIEATLTKSIEVIAAVRSGQSQKIYSRPRTILLDPPSGRSGSFNWIAQVGTRAETTYNTIELQRKLSQRGSVPRRVKGVLGAFRLPYVDGVIEASVAGKTYYAFDAGLVHNPWERWTIFSFLDVKSSSR